MSTDQPTFSGWASNPNMWGQRIQVRAATPRGPVGVRISNLSKRFISYELSAEEAEEMAVALLRAAAASRNQEGSTS